MKTLKELEGLYHSFPDRLRRLLKERKMEPKDLAKKAPCNLQVAKNWCEGISRPDLLSLMKIAAALNIGLDELVGF